MFPNRDYLAPQIRSMSNRFHLEAKITWSYDYPLANHIVKNKSSANREMPPFSRLYPSFGYLRKVFPPRGLKYSLFLTNACDVLSNGNIVWHKDYFWKESITINVIYSSVSSRQTTAQSKVTLICILICIKGLICSELYADYP